MNKNFVLSLVAMGLGALTALVTEKQVGNLVESKTESIKNDILKSLTSGKEDEDDENEDEEA